MDKKVSRKIFSEIKKAKRILLALHVSPDADSVSSVLAMSLVLERLGKKVKIISFSQIPGRLLYIPGTEKVKILDFAKEKFLEFDLFIALDSAQERMITRSSYPKNFPKNFKVINIDHHFTNTKFGDINLVSIISSTAELLYELFKFWKVKIDKKMADLLLLGIVADTGSFQYPMTSRETFLVGAELLQKGASLNETVLYLFRSYNLKTLKYWGKVLQNLKQDKGGKFVWSKISRKEKEKLGIDPSEIEGAASLFCPVINGTEFGIILLEEDGLIRGSLRSRTNFDVSKIAVEFGGGGHREAAGFSLNMSLKEAEKKVLKTARKAVS